MLNFRFRSYSKFNNLIKKKISKGIVLKRDFEKKFFKFILEKNNVCYNISRFKMSLDCN